MTALKKPLTEDQIAAIIYESLVGLDYLHNKASLIHRDIKAGNVLLTDEGQVKLGALLLAQVGEQAHLLERPFPEEMLHDSKSDIWSIGITSIEIAEKNPPLSDIHPMRALQLIPKSDIGFASQKLFKTFCRVCCTMSYQGSLEASNCSELLQHPFFAKIRNVPREKIIAELVAKAKSISEKKKAGYDDDDDDDDDRRTEARNLSQTVRQAEEAKEKRSVVKPPSIGTTSQGSIESHQSHYSFSRPKPSSPSPNSIIFCLQISAFVNAVQSAEFQHSSASHASVRFDRLRFEWRYHGTLESKTMLPVQTIVHSASDSISSGDNIRLVAKMNMNLPMASALAESEQIASTPIIATRDARSFLIEKTEATIYLTVLFRQDIVLFEWAKEPPYLKFMKLKDSAS
ncbi:hypothetical protein BSLG_010415 [Batrachochytrium salamandrivorans]|nr:hypothetical protein BSLG_010415 [Batrachochytrium salamandrivorans]